MNTSEPAAHARQYLTVAFKPGGKTYVYHNDGEPVAPNDEVKCPDPRGDPGDWIRASVVEITDEVPAFATKGILGPVLIEDGA